MKILLGAAATALAITALAGCGGDDSDGGDTATDPASSSPTTEPSDPPTVGTYPELDTANYTFLLEQLCYCPVTGPVRVTVEDGEVDSAVIAEGGHGMKKGSDAPVYLQLTINDVIAHANDTEAAEIVVDWPDGQDWPNSVAVDQIENAVDDEVTYVIRDVQVS